MNRDVQCFLDLTALASERTTQSHRDAGQWKGVLYSPSSPPPAQCEAKVSLLFQEAALVVYGQWMVWFLAGFSTACAEMRQAIFRELKITCSAGLGTGKTVVRNLADP